MSANNTKLKLTLSILYLLYPFFRCASTPSGLVGAFIYAPPDHSGTIPKFEDFPAEVKVYDIKKKALVRTISNIIAGYALGR